MILNLLGSAADKTREVGIDEAALYALLGFLVVFVGIAFLIFVIWLVGRIMTKGKKANTPSEIVTKSNNDEINTLVEEEISEETVAVITAALMAYYQKNNPKCEFTVKRIKRF